MADTPLAQTIQDAEIDARSLSEFISKDKTFMVTRRLAPTVHTLDYYISVFNDVEANLNAAIDTVAQNADVAIAGIVQDTTAELDDAVARANATADSVAANAATTAANTAKTRIDTILNDAIKDSGFVIVDSFEDGATLTTATQALRVEATGRLYRWGGALPKTVSASSTPETTGGFGLDAWVEVNDVALKQELQSENGYRLVANQMAANAYGVPGPLTDMEYKQPLPKVIEFFDGLFWGISGSTLKTSVDGEVWVDNGSVPSGTVRLIKTYDGEVLASTSDAVFKSVNFNAGSRSWRNVLQNPFTGPKFLPWGFDGYGNKFIITHYGTGQETWVDSRYVWISTDAGENWSIVWDTEAEFPDKSAQSHLHAACYDKWADRFYFTDGHGEMVGIRYSDDNGENWTRITNDYGMSPAFTVMVATDFGIVCGTDGPPNGVFLIPRAEDPDQVGVKMMGRWYEQSGNEGVIGFADRGYRDPDTGIVYIGYVSNLQWVNPIIMGVGASGAEIVHTAPSDSTNRVMNRFINVVAGNGYIMGDLLHGEHGGVFRAKTSKYNSAIYPDFGNILVRDGEFTRPSSIRMGQQSKVGGLRALALGFKSTAGTAPTNQYNIAIGYESVSSSDSTIALGRGSNADLGSSVAIGTSAKATATFALSMGRSSSATGNYAIAFGDNSKATQNYSLAVGASASAVAVGSVAIGKGSTSSNSYTIAIGDASEATNTYSMAVGANSVSGGSSSVAIGRSSATPSTESVAVGPWSATSGIRSLALGTASKATNSYAVAVGASANSGSTYSISIGADSTANGADSISIGRDSSSSSGGTINIGRSATSSGVYHIAIGRNASASAGSSSIAFGDGANVNGVSSIAVGTGASSTLAGGVAIGLNAKATHTSSVAIGSASETVRANSISIGARDIESTKAGGAIYLKSPDGTLHKITVSDAGELTVATA